MKKLMTGLLAATLLTGVAQGQIKPDHPLFHAAVHPEPPLTPPASTQGPVRAKSGETAVAIRYSGYLFGFKIVSSNFKTWYDGDDYTVYADMKSSGLGALAKKMHIWAMSKGRYDENGMYPISQIQQNTDKKNRRVNMNYDYNAKKVNVVVIPRNGSQGVPPASEKERFEADDALSAMLNLTMRGHALEADFCTGGVKVFDSKQHYNLRMERVGAKRIKFEGEKYDGYRCHVYYEPINGFDPEDLPNSEEGGTPLKLDVINRPDLGLHIPVRFTYSISGFKAVIKAKDIQISKS